MSRTKNGKDRLADALATLIQNEAAFVARLADTDARIAEIERINSERFARIESILMEHRTILAEQARILGEHGRILAEHTEILQALPEAVRERMGFKIPEKT